MSIVFKMPALSPTMLQGDIVKWEKTLGDLIENGDTLLAIETDKAIIDFEATDSGELFYIFLPDGSKSVPVGTPLAIFKEPEDTLQDLKMLVDTLCPIKDSENLAQNKPSTLASVSDKAQLFSTETASVSRPSSPLAKKIAGLHGVDLNTCTGTGPGGRIVKADVERVLNQNVRRNIPEPSTSPSPSCLISANQDDLISEPGNIKIPFTGMRGVIAQRLTQSKQEIPHFYMTISCRMDSLWNVRKELNRTHPEARVSVNDFILKATALALRAFPGMNAHVSSEGIHQFEKVSLAFAVSLEKGLITPVIENASEQSLFTLANRVRELVDRARSGRLAPKEYQNGTFTVSNLGMFQIEDFQAIINPPQVGILATSATLEKPVVDQQQLTIAKVMNVTLSADHRAVDGVLAAQFIRKFQYYIEHPLVLLAQ
ncbi:dihydrolipoamide acetyltransferase family protein [Holospora curviuscula]|uniref:Dihydrolipoamide acetyltransferase component of pyruvate dehydrogenase complex n=1 Tax=Holospora curviuscula TaxID=1082868 RepID=A0A2S5R998_9PROT|nr:dihydrolipoamide acetyltransferase family protein [Holospora curviuscula]PPE03898.1 Dihydrolipoyllysine-residue acetyltransferase component of pyruvate dehydrogenase complex [Holospora curviuscula]